MLEDDIIFPVFAFICFTNDADPSHEVVTNLVSLVRGD